MSYLFLDGFTLDNVSKKLSCFNTTVFLVVLVEECLLVFLVFLVVLVEECLLVYLVEAEIEA